METGLKDHGMETQELKWAVTESGTADDANGNAVEGSGSGLKYSPQYLSIAML